MKQSPHCRDCQARALFVAAGQEKRRRLRCGRKPGQKLIELIVIVSDQPFRRRDGKKRTSPRGEEGGDGETDARPVTDAGQHSGLGAEAGSRELPRLHRETTANSASWGSRPSPARARSLAAVAPIWSSVMRMFLAGFLHGDGSVSFSNRIDM